MKNDSSEFNSLLKRAAEKRSNTRMELQEIIKIMKR